MQLIEGGPNIPDSLLQQHADGRVVFFCGAGISQPAGLPGFHKLVEKLYKKSRVCPNSLQKEAIDNGQYDLAVDMLENQLVDGRKKVRRTLANLLQLNEQTSNMHQNLLALSENNAGVVRLVTTNYDRLFEGAVKSDRQIRTFSAPSLPIPKQSWEGIVYLHGLLKEEPDKTNLDSLVLSSADFGLAYLTERWAARFISELFKNFTVCFIGYSINDPVMRYMMDALAADRAFGENVPEAYAFCSYSEEKEQEDREEWEAKKVIPIFYNNQRGHSYLHETLSQWAKLHREGSLGKENLVRQYAGCNPKTSNAENDFVSRVIWALSDENGGPAKAFSEVKPAPCLDWLKPILQAQPLNERSARVACYLNSWLLCHLGNPELLKVVLSDQGGQFVSLKNAIDNHLTRIWGLENKENRKELDESHVKEPGSVPSPFMRSMWRLALAGRIGINSSLSFLFSWNRKFENEGLSEGLRQELCALLAPRIFIQGLAQSPVLSPVRCDDDLRSLLSPTVGLSNKFPCEVLKKLENNSKWQAALPELFRMFNYLLFDALELMKAIELAYENDDPSYLDLRCIECVEQLDEYIPDWAVLIILTRDAWLALAEVEAQRAALVAKTWMTEPYPVFKRLAFFAATQKNIIPYEQALDWLLTDKHKWLWSVHTESEAIKLLEYLAPKLNQDGLKRLEQAVISGPPEGIYGKAYHVEHIEREILARLNGLAHAAAGMGYEATEKLEELREKYPVPKEVEEGMQQNHVIIRDVGGAPIPQELSHLVVWLKEGYQSNRLPVNDWGDHCRVEPEITAQALSQLAQDEIWPVRFWGIALSAWPLNEDDAQCSTWPFLATVLVNAPDREFEYMAGSIAQWLSRVAKVSGDYEGQFFSLIDRILSQRQYVAMGTNSLFGKAINHPVGNVVLALIYWALRRKKDNDSACLPEEVKKRLENIIQCNAAGFEFGKICIAHSLDELSALDSKWVDEHVLLLFDWQRADFDAQMMWTGLLSKNNFNSGLLEPIKGEFLNTATKLESLGEHPRKQYADWLTRIAIISEPDSCQDALARATNALPAEYLADAVKVLEKELSKANNRRHYWLTYIVPYLDNVFPSTKDKKSQRLSEQFGRLCLSATDVFPEVYDKVKAWLMPGSRFSNLLQILEGSQLCEKYPEDALKFMSKVFNHKEGLFLDAARKCLDRIGKASPGLKSNAEYKKLDNFLRIY